MRNCPAGRTFMFLFAIAFDFHYMLLGVFANEIKKINYISMM